MGYFSIKRQGSGNYENRPRWISFDTEKNKLTISADLDLTKNEAVVITLTDKEKLELIAFLQNKD